MHNKYCMNKKKKFLVFYKIPILTSYPNLKQCREIQVTGKKQRVISIVMLCTL